MLFLLGIHKYLVWSFSQIYWLVTNIYSSFYQKLWTYVRNTMSLGVQRHANLTETHRAYGYSAYLSARAIRSIASRKNDSASKRTALTLCGLVRSAEPSATGVYKLRSKWTYVYQLNSRHSWIDRPMALEFDRPGAFNKSRFSFKLSLFQNNIYFTFTQYNLNYNNNNKLFSTEKVTTLLNEYFFSPRLFVHRCLNNTKTNKWARALAEFFKCIIFIRMKNK